MKRGGISVKLFLDVARGAVLYHFVKPLFCAVMALLFGPESLRDLHPPMLFDVLFNKSNVVALIQELVLADLFKSLGACVIRSERASEHLELSGRELLPHKTTHQFSAVKRLFLQRLEIIISVGPDLTLVKRVHNAVEGVQSLGL